MKKESKEAIRKELQELGSSLGAVDSTPGFRVPDAYFDQLPNTIQEKVLEKTSPSAFNLPFLVYRRLVPVMAVLLLLAGIAFSLFMMRSEGIRDQLATDQLDAELEYFAYRTSMDHDLLYDLVLESDLTADELLFGLEPGIAEGENGYDEIMEMMFEDARYYGIESSYLLSSLD